MSILATFNGVDTSKIVALSNSIQQEPAQGDTLWKAEVIWQSGFRNQIRIRDLPVSYADDPPQLLLNGLFDAFFHTSRLLC